MVVSRNIHAILVGVFTLVTSVVSSLLGYYFAHEDRQSMMRLEYDKLRAEHTLEVAKALANSQSHMISLSVDGSYALFSACTQDEDIKRLTADVAKSKPLPPLKGSTADKLNDIERFLRASDIDENTRDLLMLQVEMAKDDEARTSATVAARLKVYDELSRTLMGDTAATMQVYHPDRTDQYMELVAKFLQINGDARKLLWEMKCGSDKQFDDVGARIIEWNDKAATFVQTIAIAIKPE